MFKRAHFMIPLTLLIIASLVLVTGPTRAQDSDVIVVLAVELAQAPVEAWAAAFADTAGDVSFDLRFGTGNDLVSQIAEADILITDNYEEDPPIEFECGTISRVYLLLPGLGARYLASEDCGDYVAPKTGTLVDFLQFMVSPDGQQIAIDLGELPDSVEVVDQGGVTVSVPQPVRRIVSAYGVSTYYVYNVGASDQLVGAAYLGTKKPDISTIGQYETNIEELAALEPDLILAAARTDWLDAAEELGIPILRFEGETPAALQEAVSLLGSVLGPNAGYRAEQFNAFYDHTLQQIIDQTGSIDAVTRVYFSGTEPLRVASGDMYQTSMVEAAGGESVSKELVGYWNDVNLEQVLVWEPDVILVPTYGGASVEAFTESEEWAVVKAVQNGQVYMLPQFVAPIDTPLPDSILGIIWMAETLYPGQVDLGCEAQATYFYNTFWDYAITEEEVQGLCG
jgi:iron complex transport system substrate-binding protein